MSNEQGLGRFRPKLICLAVASCFTAGAALANPTGHTVVHGNVTVKEVGNLLKIHNSPNAVINWQSFSIGANEITRFIQQSRSSAVLNRVTGVNGLIAPSQILGTLKSNGKVYLLNSAGVLFGAGSRVDVGGLVATSLKMSDADFQANRLRFTDGAGAGKVENYGNITTGKGGEVYLVGSAVTNGGVITSPKGHVVLAAGKQVELVNPGSPNLRVEITAPDNKVLNLGDIVAESGRIGIYAGLISNSGAIRADSAVAEGGRILLKATKDVTLESSSVLDASGQGGGTIEVLAGMQNGTVNVAGRLDASAPVKGHGGFVETSAATVNVADGTVVTTKAEQGKTGLWLIDPAGDFVIGADGNMTGAQVSSSLDETSMRFETTASGGNMIVDESISWNNFNSLTLVAHNNVNVNASITNEGSGNINMHAGWDGSSPGSGTSVVNGVGSVNINAPVRAGNQVYLTAGNNINVNKSIVADAAYGGSSIYLNAIGNVNIKNATVRATGGDGAEGGYISVYGGALNIENSTLQANSTGSGSATLYLYGSGSDGVNIENSTLKANTVNGSANVDVGSGFASGNVAIRNSVLAANSTGGHANVEVESDGNLLVDGSKLTASGRSASLEAYGGNVTIKRGSSLAATGKTEDAMVGILAGFENGNVAVEGSTISASGRSAGVAIAAYGGGVAVTGSTVTAAGKTGQDGGPGAIGILAASGIDTSGSTLKATGSNVDPEQSAQKVSAAEVPLVPIGPTEGANGIVLVAGEGDVKLGFLSTNGQLGVMAMNGKIVDGNEGANIAAPSAFLIAANGIGSRGNPLETQVNSLALQAYGGEIGIANLGNLRLDLLSFGGSDAVIGTTGTFTLGDAITSISVLGHLDLRGNNGMVIDKSVSAGGDLFLSSGAGDMGIYGVSVTGHNVELAGNSIYIGSTTGTAPTSVTASHLVKATTTTNFNVLGGANSSASSVVSGEDVDLTVGGVINVHGGSASAQIQASSPDTITVTFPNRTAGGFFVNGVEGAISDGSTGFFAAGEPAVLGQSLKVTYGGVPEPVKQVKGLVESSVNDLTDDKKKLEDELLVQGDQGKLEDEKDKSLPVCK